MAFNICVCIGVDKEILRTILSTMFFSWSLAAFTLHHKAYE